MLQKAFFDLPGAVAGSDAHPPGMRTVRVRSLSKAKHSFIEILVKNSTAILSLPLIQERQL